MAEEARPSEETSNDDIKKWLDVRFWSQYITDNYLIEKADMDKEELDSWLIKMWDSTIIAAQSTDTETDDAAQWRLAAMVAGAKARGPLTRKLAHGVANATETCTTSAGLNVWTDMPHFDTAIHKAWQQGNVDAKKWRGLNSFAAKLTASGAVDLTQYGVWTIREALETDKPNEEIEPHLAAAVYWFKHCAGILAGRMQYRKHFDVEQPSYGRDVDSEGLTLRRYRLWRERLEQLSKLKGDDGENTSLARTAQEAFKIWDSRRESTEGRS